MILKGCSPYHVAQTYGDDLPISLSRLYRLIESGLLDARTIDLPEAARRKPRKAKRRGMHNEGLVNISKEGRRYGDFIKHVEENDIFHVEMDCVEGKKNESKTLLTLHWKHLQMQLAFMMGRHNAASVVAAFDRIEKALGQELFKSVFPAILTDNGSEFTDIEGMERSVFDPKVKRTHIFFCDPNRSDQKGSCEVNHKLIRKVIPKGKSLTPYDQDAITLMMNHINSYRRQKSFGKSAYDLAMAAFPPEFFYKLNLERIPDKKVNLNFDLLRDARRDYRNNMSAASKRKL